MNLTEWLTLETEDGDIEFKVFVDTEDPRDYEISNITRNDEAYQPTKDELSDMEEMAQEYARDAEIDYFNDMREMFNDD